MADSLVAGVQVRRIDDFKVLLEQCWSLFSEESQRSDDYELVQRQRDAAVAAQAEQEQTIRILSGDLHVWKESHENKCTTIEMLEAEVGRLKERVGDTQSNSLLAVCLIDGDGTIFAPEYLVEGQQGGRRAAKELNERLINHLGVSSRAAFRILVNVYCNKIGLRTTLAYAKFCTFTQFDAFWDGFQATGLFSVIDVGQGKEAADAKIRDALDLYARMPQVMRVYMGGAHDGGYQSPLSALQLSGFGDKVVLLRGYDNIIAKDLRKLGLPEARFEGLFLSKPIDTSGGWRAARSSSSDQGSPRQTDAASSSSLPSTGRACFSFHLQGSCPYGSTCAFDHNKEFTVKELDQLRQAAKTQPCMYINGNKPCSFGDACVMSHKCRNGPSCSDRTNGTCKWKGRAMHDPKTAAPKSESSHTSNSSASVTSESDRQLILCLVDGNSVNFTQDRMNEARKGGLHCAKMLEAGLRGANPNSGAQIQIIAPYIGDVSNMRVMFPRLGTCSTTQFEGFIAGYAEHDETFTVVNIPGGAPAGQDMLIKLLSAYVKLDKVKRVFLAIDGPAAGAYRGSLAALIDEGYRHKLSLIRAQETLAPDLATLGIPDIHIRGLFQKPKPHTLSSPSLAGMMSPKSNVNTVPLAMPNENILAEKPEAGSSKVPPMMPDKPPCNFLYILGKCALGDVACPYSHAKILTPADVTKLRHTTKSAPCIFVKKDKLCPYGETCCMLHRCPKGIECKPFVGGKYCPFTKKMHTA